MWLLGGCIRPRLKGHVHKFLTFHKCKGCVPFIPTEEATTTSPEMVRTASWVHTNSQDSKAASWNSRPFMNLKAVSPLSRTQDRASSLYPLKGPELRLYWANAASPSTSWDLRISLEEPKIASPLCLEICILAESRAASMDLCPFMNLKAMSPLLKNANSCLTLTPLVFKLEPRPYQKGRFARLPWWAWTASLLQIRAASQSRNSV